MADFQTATPSPEQQATMNNIDKQRVACEVALANGFAPDTKDVPCDFNPMGNIVGLMDAGVDKFGRFWAWDPEAKMLRMVNDPREARS